MIVFWYLFGKSWAKVKHFWDKAKLNWYLYRTKYNNLELKTPKSTNFCRQGRRRDTSVKLLWCKMMDAQIAWFVANLNLKWTLACMMMEKKGRHFKKSSTIFFLILLHQACVTYRTSEFHQIFDFQVPLGKKELQFWKNLTSLLCPFLVNFPKTKYKSKELWSQLCSFKNLCSHKLKFQS